MCGPYPFRLKQRFLKRMKEDDVMRDVESLIHFFFLFSGGVFIDDLGE